MLTGAVPPSDGYATILGNDMRNDLSLIRKDILFPDLTEREYIEFFTRLHGLYERMSVAAVNDKIDQWIKDIALFEQRHSRSKVISGGIKRTFS